jgi:hypothetical protein
MHKLSLAFVAVLPLLACAPATEAPDQTGPTEFDESTSEELASGSYFIVTRQDFRKCMYPICGGWFAKRVNHYFTKCASGSWASECHVADVNLSALGLSEEEANKFENEVFGQGYGLVRGSLSKVDGADTLTASEAWTGSVLTQPEGGFWRVKDSGLVCITTPCGSLTEELLNTNIGYTLHGLDLAYSGANEKQVEAGISQLGAPEGTLVAGYHNKFKGPGGTGWNLNASEFYLPVKPAKKVCGTVYIAPPDTTSPTFYAKNFDSEAAAWDWINTNFPNGQEPTVWEGSCDQPKACIKIFKPVCGVIKSGPEFTYSNSCHFEAAIMGDAGPEGESKGFYNDGACEEACDYSDPNKSYVAQSPEACMAVKFVCQEGEQPFFDDCGCGCEIATK